MKTKIESNPHGYLVYGFDNIRGWQLVGCYEVLEEAKKKAAECSLKDADFKPIYYEDGRELSCEE